MSLEKKIMYGLENIHIAKIENGKYNTPIAIEGAKSLEASFAYSIENARCGKSKVQFKNFVGGSGKLNILGLTHSEQNLIFGNAIEENFLKVNVLDSSPRFALMFSKKNALGEDIGYCIYNIRFNPISLGANTIVGGAMEEEIIELEFSIDPNENGDIYYLEKGNENFFNKVKIL